MKFAVIRDPMRSRFAILYICHVCWNEATKDARGEDCSAVPLVMEMSEAMKGFPRENVLVVAAQCDEHRPAAL